VDAVIRSYRPEDEAGVVGVWDRTLVADRISLATWRTKVLLDPNFDPELCLVAADDGNVRGFCLAIVRQVPFFGDRLQSEHSWITAFAVVPESQRQEIGSRLLAATLERLRQSGRREVAISPYVPNYFAPGVDVDAYPGAVAFLERHGFAVVSRPIGMHADLEGYVVPPAVEEAANLVRREGIVVGVATARDILPTLALIRRHFSWDWWREAQEVCHALFAGDPRGVGLVVARQGDRVLGYAQHRGEHFGPFGVDPDCRGQGIGRVLLAETMMGMVQQGYHCAWFLWTGEQAARGVYASCGFRIRRRFAILRKGLSAED
jgi:mycothiol synthase